MALGEVAAGILEPVFLLLGFHTFGNDLNAQLMGHRNDGFGDRLAARIDLIVLYEGRVQLQIGQRGIAAAKVVKGQLDAGFLEFRKTLTEIRHALQEYTFGHLKYYAGPAPGKALQIGIPELVVAAPRELQGRSIDAYLECQAGHRAPATGVGGSFSEHPVLQG